MGELISHFLFGDYTMGSHLRIVASANRPLQGKYVKEVSNRALRVCLLCLVDVFGHMPKGSSELYQYLSEYVLLKVKIRFSNE